MGFVQKRLWFSICVLCFCLLFVSGRVAGDGDDRAPPEVSVEIDDTHIAETDENYVCATMDLWPETKCNFGDCPWEKSSILNVELNHHILRSAVKAFGTLRMRLGGTLQDRLIYQTEKDEHCEGFSYNPAQTLDFSHACLSLERWDQINSFIVETGGEAVFGLNALSGKKIETEEVIEKGKLSKTIRSAVGEWESSNSESLIRYSVKKGYHKHIIGWTLGNELGGRPLYLKVSADQYVKDTKKLHSKINEIYEELQVPKMPKVIGPGAIYDRDWYQKYIEETPEHLDVTTHHMYNLLAPDDVEKLKERILTASFFDTDTAAMFWGLKYILDGTIEVKVAEEELNVAEEKLKKAKQDFTDAEDKFNKAKTEFEAGRIDQVDQVKLASLDEDKVKKSKKLEEATEAKENAEAALKDAQAKAVKDEDDIKNNLKKRPKAVAWIGESGGAFHSGKRGVSNAFINGFWYLNMLGFAARTDTKTYCRQTLIGGNYGLLDTNTYIPNPDYYNALLWHRLMGTKVLLTTYKETTPKNVYTYAHCGKKNIGVSMLVLNQDEKIPFKASFDVQKYGKAREEYRLTPVDGDILSREVKLNGNLLHVGPTGDENVNKTTIQELFIEIRITRFHQVLCVLSRLKFGYSKPIAIDSAQHIFLKTAPQPL